MHVFWCPERQGRRRIQSSAAEAMTMTNDCLCSWMNNLRVATSDHYSNWKEWLPAENKPSLIESLISPLPNHFPSAIIQQKGADSQLPPFDAKRVWAWLWPLDGSVATFIHRFLLVQWGGQLRKKGGYRPDLTDLAQDQLWAQSQQADNRLTDSRWETREATQASALRHRK